MLQRWGEQFATSGVSRGRWYFDVQNCVSLKPWFVGSGFSKRDISCICRMRLGHCCTASHLTRIGVFNDPTCQCGEEEETLDHIFFVCGRYDRGGLYAKIVQITKEAPLSMKYLLSLNNLKIFQLLVEFLREYDIKL